MSRINKVFLIAGNRGKGKTDFLKNHIMSSSQQKKIIVDTFDSPVWHTMKTWNHPEWEQITVSSIDPTEIHTHKSGIIRVFGADTKAIMHAISKLAYNSLLVFEDATKYIGSKLTDDVRYFVLDSKQKNLDIMFTFHSLADIPNDLIRVSDYLTLFKTGDFFNSSLRNKYQGKPVEQLFNVVQKDTNNFVNKTIEISG